MIDILVQMQVVEKYLGRVKEEGLQHLHSKKDFLKAVGEMWEVCKANPQLKISFQLNNMEDLV